MASRMVANFFIDFRSSLELAVYCFAAQGPYRPLRFGLEAFLYQDGNGGVLEPDGGSTVFVVPDLTGKLEGVEEIVLVIRYTGRWLQYGIIGHAVLCILIAAIEQTLK